MLNTLESVAGATVRWLALGRGVIVRGDGGSGRSTVLQAVARHGEQARLSTVVVDWRDLASSQVRVAAGPRPPRVGTEVVDELVEDLGPRGVLLVDDLDLCGDETVEALDQVLRRSRALLVATVAYDVARTSRAPLARLVTAHAPAEVRIPPLGYQAMAQLIAGRLAGPADATLVSSVAAWSAGNPAVAVAMVDAIQFAGLIERRNESWSTVGDLDKAPLDAVAHLMMAGLPAGSQGTLEVLSVLGPASAEVVGRLVPEADLADLVARNRVVSYGRDDGDVLAVSPPALSRAVRARLSEPRRLEVARLMLTEIGVRGLPLPTVRTGLADMILASTGEQYEAYWRWAAELTGLVHEQAVVAEARARGIWEEDPRVRTALPYLVALLRRPGTERTREVFDGTVRWQDELPHEADLFDHLRTLWLAWHVGDATDPYVDLDSPRPTGLPATASEELRALAEQARVRGWDDEELWRRSGLPFVGESEPRRSMSLAGAAAVLLEAGRYELVLRVVDAADVPAWLPAETEHSLAGLRAMALLLADRVTDAESAARARLEAAYDALDLPGIRVHSVTLAHALTVLGQWTAAWRVLSTALRLGPPGPLGSAFHRRTLTLATMLASQVENFEVAQMLLSELRHAHPLHEPVVDTMQGVAEAYVQMGRGEHADAEAIMWRGGARSLAAGKPMLALEYWALRIGPSTVEQVEQMSALSAAVPLPLFAPLVDLRAALLAHDLPAIERAVRTARMAMVPGMVPLVVAAVAELRRQTGAAPLTDAELDDLLGERLAEVLRSTPRQQHVAEPLSVREREVALLAAQGLTNREIAERLHLSRRTAENHVHRALRKLGLASRAELAGATF
ncbi:MAG TPA: response regulator transcription factor [Cellulomonas sp.]